MRLDVTVTQGSGFTEVTASHKGEELVFPTGTYGKVRLNDPKAVFKEINAYWEWLGDKACDAIWEAYKEIKDHLDHGVDTAFMAKHIQKHIAAMYKHMPMESFSKWLLTRGGLYIPADIQDVIVEGSRYSRPDQTYLKEDYINLAALALSLRPVLPIWAEYIDPSRQGDTNDLYKEMEAVSLIIGTDIVKWPEDQSAFDKLGRYIQIRTENMPVSTGNLWRGIGTSEISLWLQARVMVRRLTIVPLTDHNAAHSIIANVYNYVDSNMNPTDRNRSDRVTDKLRDGGEPDDEDKSSYLELYKVKQRVTTGDVELMNVYSKNMVGIAQTVDPTIDLNLLEMTTAKIEQQMKHQVYPHQIRLAQWVLAKGYSPRAFYQINKSSVCRLLATAQALLWHWGFLDIACLMQVERVSSTVQNIPGITQRPRGGSRISRKYDEDLMTHYPHMKPQRLTQKQLQTGVEEPPSRSNNLAAIGINSVTREIHRYDWLYHGPTELKKLAGQTEGRGLVILAPKLKDQITELVIHLAKVNQ